MAGGNASPPFFLTANITFFSFLNFCLFSFYSFLFSFHFLLTSFIINFFFFFSFFLNAHSLFRPLIQLPESLPHFIRLFSSLLFSLSLLHSVCFTPHFLSSVLASLSLPLIHLPLQHTHLPRQTSHLPFTLSPSFSLLSQLIP